MAACPASLDILNTKSLISPEREDFRSNFDRFMLGLYMFYWQLLPLTSRLFLLYYKNFLLIPFFSSFTNACMWL